MRLMRLTVCVTLLLGILVVAASGQEVNDLGPELTACQAQVRGSPQQKKNKIQSTVVLQTSRVYLVLVSRRSCCRSLGVRSRITVIARDRTSTLTLCTSSSSCPKPTSWLMRLPRPARKFLPSPMSWNQQLRKLLMQPHRSQRALRITSSAPRNRARLPRALNSRRRFTTRNLLIINRRKKS